MPSWIKKNKKDKIINQNKTILKINLSAFFLVLSLITSFIEIRLLLPNGSEFDLRILDTLFLLLCVSVVGYFYTIIISVIQPWLHLLIDSDHLPISILFYSISNVMLVTIFWLFFIYIFKINKISYNKNKFKKISFIFISLIPILLVVSFIDVISIIIVGVINTGQFIFKNEFIILVKVFAIFFVIYIAKYIFIILLYLFLMPKLRDIIKRYNLV